MTVDQALLQPHAGQAEAVCACRLLVKIADSSRDRAGQLAAHLSVHRRWTALLSLLTWAFWRQADPHIAGCPHAPWHLPVSLMVIPAAACCSVGCAVRRQLSGRAEALLLAVRLLDRMAGAAPGLVGSQPWVFGAVTRAVQQSVADGDSELASAGFRLLAGLSRDVANVRRMLEAPGDGPFIHSLLPAVAAALDPIGLLRFRMAARPVPVLALEVLEHIAEASPALASFEGVMAPLLCLLDGRKTPPATPVLLRRGLKMGATRVLRALLHRAHGPTVLDRLLNALDGEEAVPGGGPSRLDLLAPRLWALSDRRPPAAVRAPPLPPH